MSGDSVRKSIRDYENMREFERTYTAEEVALERAVIVREAAEVLNAIGGMPDGFCVCFNSFRDPLKSEHTGECQAARAFLAIPTDQSALDKLLALNQAAIVREAAEIADRMDVMRQALVRSEIAGTILAIPTDQPALDRYVAERVQQAVLAHTIEARRLYLGSSRENYLNWLEKRIEAGRAAASPASQQAEEDGPQLTYVNGDHSCAECGFGMHKPCKHWQKLLAQAEAPEHRKEQP